MAFLYNYEINNGILVVKSTENNQVIWKGKPKGYDVIEVFPIEGTDDCIILLEWLKTGMENQKNLLRIDFQGNLVWEIEDPPINFTSGPLRALETESYTSVIKVEEKFIVAYAYSGFADYIDIETGIIIKSEFTK